MNQDEQQSPWGRGGGPKTPEEFLAQLLKKVKASFAGGDRGGGEGGGEAPKDESRGRGKWRGLGLVVIIVLVALAFRASSAVVYTIKPGERGVVLRLGKYSGILEPGLNFVLPFIDTVEKVDIESVRKEEFGFRTVSAGQRSQFAKDAEERSESLMLTGDTNVIDVEWIVQYKVRDPVNFLFKVSDVRQSVRDVSETVMRRVVGNMGFDFMLSNRELVAAQTAREVQAALDVYEAGVNIVTVQLQDVNPPDQVKPAFNEVNEADQDMKRLVNEAEEAYNKVVPRAQGDAKKILEQSRGYAVERINVSKGDTVRYLALLREYQRAKDVTRRRMYLETMEEVLPQAADIFVIDNDQRSILPFLDVAGGKRATPAPPAAK